MTRITSCNYAGCARTAQPGTTRCWKHPHTTGWGRYAEKFPDRARFYQGGGWREARRRHLQAHPDCEICGAPAVAVDHIRPRAEGGAGLDPSNLQSLCEVHHQAKTLGESHRGRKRAAQQQKRRKESR